MEGQRWLRVRAMVERALDVDPREREAFLERECAGDRELSGEVRALLEHDPRTGSLEPPPSEVVARTLRSSAAGRRIGAWRLEREIGSGGMGSVWLAQRADGGFAQRAAVKLIKHGMDTDALLARFERERRVLATLEHPNIARLYDGGSTDDGRPYLVMEYVEGLPLDRHCGERELGLRARVELFLTVCAAVQHAHRNLVVHRDLKPSNVMVTADGVAKLLDFGIAKVLESDDGSDAQTLEQDRVLTPRYASPEQLAGRPPTTQSDVFSLGAVLYELIVGQPAFDDGRKPDTEALAPSRAARSTGKAGARALDRDLDMIALTALRTDPARRYASVEALADDLRRYLDGLPVRARADTLAYRINKFVRRNKLAVGAALALVAALAAGLVATATQYRAAVLARESEKASRELAERRFSDVRNLANRFVYNVDGELARIAGSTAARQMLVDTASEYLDRLAAERAQDRELALDVASTYTRLAEILYQPGSGSLGKPTEALAMLDKSVAIASELHAADPARALVTLRLAQAWRAHASTFAALGKQAEAIAELERADELLATMPDDEVESWVLGMKAELPALLADLRLITGDPGGAQRAAEESVARSQALVAARPDRAEALALLSRAHTALARALSSQGNIDDAGLNLSRTIELLGRCREIDPERASYVRDLAVANFRLQQVLADAQRWDDALGPAEEALRLFGEISALDPRDGIALQDLSTAHSAVETALSALDRGEEAFEHATTALEIAERRVELEEHDVSARTVLAIACFRFGARLIERGDDARGFARLREARDQFERVAAASPDDVDAQSNCATALCDIGMTLMDRGGNQRALWEEARVNLDAGLERMHALAQRGALSTSALETMAEYEKAVGECAARLAEM